MRDKQDEQYLQMLEESITTYPGPGGPIAWWDSKSGKKMPFTSDASLTDIVKKVAGTPGMDSAEERAKDSLDMDDNENDFDKSASPDDRQIWEGSPMDALEDDTEDSLEEINLTEVESEVLSRLIEDMEEFAGEDTEGDDADLNVDITDDLPDEGDLDLELDDLAFGDEDSIDI